MTTSLTCRNSARIDVRLDGDSLIVSVRSREFEPVSVASIRSAPLILAGRVIAEAYRSASGLLPLTAPRDEVRSLASVFRRMIAAKETAR